LGRKAVSGIMLVLLTISIVSLAFNIQPAKARTITVPDDYPTIQEAVNAASPGDTIEVAPGVYYENILVTKDGLTLLGSGADVTIIDGQDKYNVVYAYEITSFTIEGFTIRNSSHTGSSPGSVGIHINPRSRWGGDFAIRKCRIQDNWNGIAIWNHEWGTIIIENNIISNNDGIGLDASYPIGDGEVIIRSNTIVCNGWDGYYDWAGGGYHVLINNIIVSNRFGIHSHVNTPRYIAYNNVWNNSEGNYVEGYTGYGDINPFTPSPGTGEISTNPLFIDATNRDYHLNADSPCIDAGTNEEAPSVDFDGNPRPIDGNVDGIAIVDMGAYEFIPPPEITATVDIDPDTLNLKSESKWITAYIELPEGYDVSDINVSSILLNDTIPVDLSAPIAVGDYDEDGILDLMVKFDRASVISYILANINKTKLFEERSIRVILTITGYLNDGTLFQGTATIRVLMPVPFSVSRHWRCRRTLQIFPI